MTCWLAISTRNNWDQIKKKNVWGVAKRHINTINKVKIGDTLLVYNIQAYVNKEVLPSVITGAFKVISSVYEDNEVIFSPPNQETREVFPLRVKLEPIKIFKKPIEFKPLISELSFIKNKKLWTGHFRGKAMRTIPEEDCRLIISQAEA